MSRQSGFTLLELMIVLVIGAAAYALILGVPLRGVGAAELKSAARTVASGLRTAQTTAMTTRRDALLTMDVESREFVVTGHPQPRKLAEGIDVKLDTAQQELASERKGAIRFYPDGSSTGGRVTLSAGERKYRVDVDWLTGRVTIGE